MQLVTKKTGKSVAIVGAGPSGLYLAQALLRAHAEVEITLIEKLATPFGLIRYGVASDHQGQKQVAQQFDQVLDDPRLHFVAGVSVGEELPFEALAENFDTIVLASGIAADRKLGIAGEDLPGVIQSGLLTRWLNDYPDIAHAPPKIGRDVLIIGNGNVALDSARLLLKHSEDFCQSDLSDRAMSILNRSGFRRVTILGRSGLAGVKFDPSQVRQLAKLRGVQFVLNRSDADTAANLPLNKQAVVTALGDVLCGQTADFPTGELRFEFNQIPGKIERFGKKLRVWLQPVADSDSRTTKYLEVDNVITAIGFEAGGSDLNPAELVAAYPEVPIFSAGWLLTGPTGTIPDQRSATRLLVPAVLNALAEAEHKARSAVGFASPAVATRSPAAEPLSAHQKNGWSGLQSKLPAGWLDYRSWQVINQAELARAPENRVRSKFQTSLEFKAVALEKLTFRAGV